TDPGRFIETGGSPFFCHLMEKVYGFARVLRKDPQDRGSDRGGVRGSNQPRDTGRRSGRSEDGTAARDSGAPDRGWESGPSESGGDCAVSSAGGGEMERGATACC